MKRAVLLFLLFAPSFVSAETFTWNAPTTRTDGSPVDPATDIKRYKFYRGVGLVAANIEKPAPALPPPTTINWSPPVGTTQYWVTAVDQAGTESGISERVTLVVTPTPTATPTPTNTPLPPLSPPFGFQGEP